MASLETNIYAIDNLSQLSSRYRLHRIKGLSPTHDEYFRNRQIIQSKLSYQLQHPVTVIEQEALPYVVVRDDLEQELPQHLRVVRNPPVSFEARDTLIDLDYTDRSPINDAICLRFLQFTIQGAIRQHQNLWQTQSGRPFYKKKPIHRANKCELYTGFVLRPMITHEGGIGLCIDITSKTLGQYPLPTYLALNNFHRWRYQNCVYRYGDQWFEIQIDSLSDYTYSEHLIELDDEWTSLQQFVTRNASEPLPPDVANVPADSAVVMYYNNREEERAAPTSLCFPILGTDDPRTSPLHRKSILQPHKRREQIQEVVRDYLSNLAMGDIPIKIRNSALVAPKRMFQVPDLRFGNDTVLSVRQTPGAEHTELDILGRTRQSLLERSEAGFYRHSPLDRQYIILPESIHQSWGKQFVEDLKHEMEKQYPDGSYNPNILSYDDSGKRTFVQQGRQIQAFIRGQHWKPGYALIMVHHTDDRKLRDEDQLAALVLSELRKQDVIGSVIHSEAGDDCYRYITDRQGKAAYVWDRRKRGKITGYLQNVALNKVLLTNSRWPFILDTPLHADIIIGLDVKNNTAGLVVIGKRGRNIRPFQDESKQKEKLREGQAHQYFLDLLRDEIAIANDLVRHIVVHRDGIAFDTEIQGIKKAIEELKAEETLPSDATLTILEIVKSAMVSVRLFDVTKNHNRKDYVINPQVGECYIVNSKDAFLCSTGRAFEHKGTSHPLHIRYVEGGLDFEKCLKDVYALTTLAWTRPRDCSRYPITIKLNDRLLLEAAAEYDADELRFSMTQEE